MTCNVTVIRPGRASQNIAVLFDPPRKVLETFGAKMAYLLKECFVRVLLQIGFKERWKSLQWKCYLSLCVEHVAIHVNTCVPAGVS